MNRYKYFYEQIVARDLAYKIQYKNLHEIPKIESIHLNLSTKDSLLDRKKILPFIAGLQILSGQKLRKTYAKKSIAGFKLRSGQLLGAAGTLRKSVMYNFLDKLFTIVFPKIRDFEGIQINDNKKTNSLKYISFSGASYLLYPELENHYELFESIKGFNITIKSPSTLLFFVLPRTSKI